MSTAGYTDQVHADISEPQQTGVHDALQLLVLGGVCGLMFHWLVWGQSGGGLGLLLWSGLSCATALWLNRQQSTGWRRELLCWCAVIMAAALMTVWRDALAVRALMYVVMLLCLGLIFFRAAGNSLMIATIPLALWAVLRFPPRVLLGFFPAVDAVLNARWKNSGRVAGVFRGLVLAAPLLLVFVMLFASADAVFSQQLERLGQAIDGLAPQTPLISLMLSVIATGVLSCSLLLALGNPAARVAQVNLLHARTSGMPVDIDYLVRLGADSVPVIIRYLDPAGLSQPSQNQSSQNQSSQNQSGRSQSGLTQNEAASTVMCRATERWFARWQVADADWRNWNAARAAAARDVSGLQRGCQGLRHS